MAKKHKKYLSIIFKKILNILACFKKYIVWILQQVCKIPKDMGLYFKYIKNLFLARKYYSLLI
jgi:hypothetical protein